MSKLSELNERVAKRTKSVGELLDEKERHVLTFVFHGVPRPYYVRWKQEANDTFTLMVSIKNRRKVIAERAAKEVAETKAAAAAKMTAEAAVNAAAAAAQQAAAVVDAVGDAPTE